MTQCIRVRFALIFVFVACSLTNCSGSTRTGDQGAVGVILDPEDVGSPPSKDKYCRYAGRMITSCEFQIILNSVPDPEASIEIVGRAYAVIQRRERARLETCINRGMTRKQAADGWECLESLTDCSQLPRCVGNAYRAPTTEVLPIQLLTPRKR